MFLPNTFSHLTVFEFLQKKLNIKELSWAETKGMTKGRQAAAGKG